MCTNKGLSTLQVIVASEYRSPEIMYAIKEFCSRITPDYAILSEGEEVASIGAPVLYYGNGHFNYKGVYIRPFVSSPLIVEGLYEGKVHGVELNGIIRFFGDHERTIRSNDIYEFRSDFIADAFMLLSGADQLHTVARDSLGRVSITDKVNIKWIHRPIIDETALYIRKCIESLGYNLQPLVALDYQVSHDIDFFRKFSSNKIIKPLLGDLLKRRDFRKGCERIFTALGFCKDAYDTFDYLVAAASEFGYHAIFFFLVDNVGQPHMLQPDIEKAANIILEHGHEIGLHIGFDSYSDKTGIIREQEMIRELTGCFPLKTRSHCLRWDVLATPGILEECGISDDYSIGTGRTNGFLRGTGRPFKLFNMIRHIASCVNEHPLCCMDTVLLNADKATDSILQDVKQLYRNTLDNYGEFNLLWHNSNIVNRNQKKMFRSILERMSIQK